MEIKICEIQVKWIFHIKEDLSGIRKNYNSGIMELQFVCPIRPRKVVLTTKAGVTISPRLGSNLHLKLNPAPSLYSKKTHIYR